MEGGSSRKRPHSEDSDSDRQRKQKRVRFPKGKKVKPGADPIPIPIVDEAEVAVPTGPLDPLNAAMERAKRRSQMTNELFAGEEEPAEVHYEDDEHFVDNGIQIEPCNLEKEREEGYFDDAGNFVEYISEREVKDAWLDSAKVEPKLAEKAAAMARSHGDAEELFSDNIGQMKRRIASALEPGETVLQALRRLKGHSNSKKEKMSPETKAIFDQLTDDAMKLMENGDYDVYHEKREVSEREAEGYESLAWLRNNQLASSPDLSESGAAATAGDDADSYDMFGEEEDPAKPLSEENNLVPANPIGASSNLSGEDLDHASESTLAEQSGYVFDESSGYYYSSSLGYYYDPSLGLYCNAATGQWYCYDGETGTYNEVQGTALTMSQ